MRTPSFPKRDPVTGHPLAAVPLTRYRGRKMYRIPVLIRQSGLDRDEHWQTETVTRVIAPTPADAANLVRDEIAAVVDYPTEIFAIGPKGGETYRFIGWDSLTFARICLPRRRTEQLALL